MVASVGRFKLTQIALKPGAVARDGFIQKPVSHRMKRFIEAVLFFDLADEIRRVAEVQTACGLAGPVEGRVENIAPAHNLTQDHEKLIEPFKRADNLKVIRQVPPGLVER